MKGGSLRNEQLKDVLIMKSSSRAKIFINNMSPRDIHACLCTLPVKMLLLLPKMFFFYQMFPPSFFKVL